MQDVSRFRMPAGFLYAQNHLDRDTVLEKFEADCRVAALLEMTAIWGGHDDGVGVVIASPSTSSGQA